MRFLLNAGCTGGVKRSLAAPGGQRGAPPAITRAHGRPTPRPGAAEALQKARDSRIRLFSCSASLRLGAGTRDIALPASERPSAEDRHSADGLRLAPVRRVLSVEAKVPERESDGGPCQREVLPARGSSEGLQGDLRPDRRPGAGVDRGPSDTVSGVPARERALALALAVVLVACDGRIGDYVPVSSLADAGFARDVEAARRLEGREIAMWGFVDHANIYAEPSTRSILGEWWSGEGPDGASWRFHLAAAADDPAGRSVPVTMPNDAGRDALLARFAADARAGRPTRVFLRARLFTFDAPANFHRRLGLAIAADSSAAVRLAPTGGQ